MSSISAGTTSATALVHTADTTGALELKTNNGTVAVTIDTSQRAAFVAGTAALPAITTSGDTNTGIFFSAADTIDFAEGGTACGQFDSSANFKFNSGYGSVATAYGCRAWVNFNGTGTVAIRASGNVSSITDNGTGNYTANFTTAMPDTNFGVALTGGSAGAFGTVAYEGNAGTGPVRTTSSVRFETTSNVGTTLVDDPTVNVMIFR